MFASMTNKNKISKSSLDNNDSPKTQYPTTVVPDTKNDPPLEGGYSTFEWV